MKYKAKAVTGETVVGEYIQNDEYRRMSCQHRIADWSGLEHDIIRETLKIKHKGKYRSVNWECDNCDMPMYVKDIAECSLKHDDGIVIDPPYFCEECENITVEQAESQIDNEIEALAYLNDEEIQDQIDKELHYKLTEDIREEVKTIQNKIKELKLKEMKG